MVYAKWLSRLFPILFKCESPEEEKNTVQIVLPQVKELN